MVDKNNRTIKHTLTGWCAFNRGEPDIDNMSFETTKEKAIKYWNGQEIRKCKVIIYE